MSRATPAKKRYQVYREGVLAEFDASGGDSADFWDAQWQSQNIERVLSKAQRGELTGMEFLLGRIPRDSKVLEAGCGKGQIVAALAHHGHCIAGVDFAEETVRQIKAFMPEHDIRVADIRSLPFPDNHFGTYLSFGVIEHFDDSDVVRDILSEAKRVTQDRIFVSVPFYSAMIQKRVRKNELPKWDGKSVFYQYYFTKAALTDLLRAHGLEPYAFDYYATLVALQRHSKMFSMGYRLPPFRKIARWKRAWLDRFLGPKSGHMIGAWCQKSDAGAVDG